MARQTLIRDLILAGEPRTSMTTDEAYAALRSHPDLPSPEGVALEIMRLARSRGGTLSDLAKVVEADPAIASRVIRIVNSSAYPHDRPIISLMEAIAYLGTRMVECIALSYSLVSSGNRCRSFDYVGFWSESLARAVAASRIGQVVGSYVPDELFTIALMSQLGRLVLASTRPEQYATLLGSFSCRRRELPGLERELFDIDHIELTARLMSDWDWPAEVCDGVRLQYQTDQADFDWGTETGRLAGALAIASGAAEQIVGRQAHRVDPAQILEQAYRIGLEPTAVADLIAHVVPHWREMVAIFNLDEISLHHLRALYAEAAALRLAIEAGQN